MNELGKKVREIRLANGMSQQQFALSLGYSHKSVINKIESGQRDMSYEKILLMVKMYGLDINDVISMMPNNEKTMVNNKNQRVVVYIHGRNSSRKEYNFYKSFIVGYDVKMLDYEDGDAWVVGPLIKEKFAKLIAKYKEVVVIAHSIGAFYAIDNLYEFPIKKAFFISPITDMFQVMFDMMNSYKVTEKKLKEQGEIKLENGFTLSYDFYKHSLEDFDNWNVPTEVLFGNKDGLTYLNNTIEFISTHNASLTIKNDADHYFQKPDDLAYIKKWILRYL